MEHIVITMIRPRRAELDCAVYLGGPHFFNIGETAQLSVNPPAGIEEKEGIFFRLGYSLGDSNIIPMNLAHTFAQNDIYGRRITLSQREGNRGIESKLPEEGRKVQVIEHLAAALHIAGIHNASISIRNRGALKNLIMPATGPGIKEYVDKLVYDSTEDDMPFSYIESLKSNRFEHTNPRDNIVTKVEMEQSENLEIIVVSGKHPDLTDVKEKEFKVSDAYAQKDSYVDARPVARLTGGKGASSKLLGWLKYAYWKQANLRGYKGITDDTYIIATPWDSPEDIRKKMHPRFQDDANEYLAHTVLDFMGELYMIGNCPIKGKFTLTNTNHPTRLAALKKFVMEGSLLKTPCPDYHRDNADD